MRFYYLLKRKQTLTLIVGGLFFLVSTGLLKAQLGFNDHGCYVNIKTGTSLHVDGNITLENNAQLNNSGEIEIKGDWANNSGSTAFVNTTEGAVKFSGADQSVGGVSATTFNNINLIGTGTKTLSNISELTINGNLTAGESGISNVLVINQHTSLVLIGGDFTINSGSTYQENGAGISVSGNMNILGDYTGTKNFVLTGSGTQIISGASFSAIENLTINKSDGHIVLATPVTIKNSLILTKGYVLTDETNLLTIDTSGNTSGGSDSSFVSGPVKKIGNSAFTFPLGDATLLTGAYHPLNITAPDLTTDAFKAQYFAQRQTFGDSIQTDSLESISNCEYFTLSQTFGNSAITPTISWNSNSCKIENYNDLRVAYWDSSSSLWKSIGIGNIMVNDNNGTLSAASGIHFNPIPAPIVIGRSKGDSYEALLKRELDGGYYVVKNGALKFKYDEEYNDVDNKLTFKIYNNLNQVIVTNTIMPTALQPTVFFGDNRKSINLLNCSLTPNGRLGSGFFILEVINEKNEKRYLRFKHVVTVSSPCPVTEVEVSAEIK